MLPFNSNHLPLSAFYKKALDIFTLSSHISKYLEQDLGGLKNNGNEDVNIYFTGDIVQQSIALAPEILKAESKIFQEEKYQHIASLNHLTNILYKNCERLEKVNSNGKEFVALLRKELKKFRSLQRNWMLTL